MCTFQAETEQKENLGNALAEARKALDESRQERGALRYEVDAKNRRSEALATELHLTETTLSEKQAEVVLLKQHERDYLLRIAGLEVWSGNIATFLFSAEHTVGPEDSPHASSHVGLKKSDTTCPIVIVMCMCCVYEATPACAVLEVV